MEGLKDLLGMNEMMTGGAAKRRGPGRPRKAGPAKRHGPGRPRKAGPAKRRGPGRPRKAVAAKAKVVAKRGPGRPRKYEAKVRAQHVPTALAMGIGRVAKEGRVGRPKKHVTAKSKRVLAQKYKTYKGEIGVPANAGKLGQVVVVPAKIAKTLVDVPLDVASNVAGAAGKVAMVPVTAVQRIATAGKKGTAAIAEMFENVFSTSKPKSTRKSLPLGGRARSLTQAELMV